MSLYGICVICPTSDTTFSPPLKHIGHPSHLLHPRAFTSLLAPSTLRDGNACPFTPAVVDSPLECATPTYIVSIVSGRVPCPNIVAKVDKCRYAVAYYLSLHSPRVPLS